MLSLNHLKLRSIIEDDLDMVLGWRNSETVRRYMLNDQIIVQEEHIKWFQRVSNDPNCECHIVEFRGKPVGVISITDIRRKDGTCTWGMYIGEEMRNLGIGVLMEISAIDRMVYYHKIRKIWGETIESNRRVILMHKRFGFRVEGVFKKHIGRGDGFEDVIRIALFSYKWPAIRKKLISTLKICES